MDEQTQPIRERFHERLKAARLLPAAEQKEAVSALEREFAPIKHLLSPPKVPIGLLACFTCRRPISRCICRTVDDKPLDWREGAALS